MPSTRRRLTLSLLIRKTNGLSHSQPSSANTERESSIIHFRTFSRTSKLEFRPQNRNLRSQKAVLVNVRNFEGESSGLPRRERLMQFDRRHTKKNELSKLFLPTFDGNSPKEPIFHELHFANFILQTSYCEPHIRRWCGRQLKCQSLPRMQSAYYTIRLGLLGSRQEWIGTEWKRMEQSSFGQNGVE